MNIFSGTRLQPSIQPQRQYKQAIVAGISTLLLLLSHALFAYEKIDKVIAVVDDDVIFSSELERRVVQFTARLKTQGQSVQEQSLRPQLLERLIAERLQLRIAARNKLTISEADLDKAMERTRNNLAQTGVAFDQYLNAQKLTLNDARKQLEQEMLIERVQQGVINRRINVTEKEIDNFLESKSGKDWLTTRYRIEHILLPVEKATDSETKVAALAQRLYNTVKQPDANFRQVAATYSKGPNASKGGDLGIIKKDDLPSLFVTHISSINPGEVTPPFRSNAGFHILKLVNRSGAEPVIIEQSLVRHLLVKTTELFTSQEAEAKINVLYQRLLNGEDFAELAQENTDDVGSKLKGGSVGWSTPGKFVPEFENTINATAVGDISRPFLSQFGWHILKVDERRKKDVFESVKRNQVAKILRSQRFQDERQIWLQELRDEAYVEILI